MISGLRDYALSLACRSRGLPASHGRGYDELPLSVPDIFKGALVSSLERDELLRALRCAIDGFAKEAIEVLDLAERVGPQLREMLLPLDTDTGRFCFLGDDTIILCKTRLLFPRRKK